MASGWKDHRGRSAKSSSTQAAGSHGPGNGVAGCNHVTADVDRNDVPQRPPTVGQELPNNLDWPLDAQARSARNRKRGNLDKNRDKKLDTSADGRSSDGVPATIWPPPQSHQLADRAKQVAVACDVESTSDGDANSRCTPNHGARPKRDFIRKKDRAFFQSENDIPPQKMTVKKTNRLNINQVVGKLGQIRDYIKQVTDTVDALQKAGDTSAVEQMEKLYHFRTDLQQYEHRLCEILQGVPINSMQADGLNSDVASLGSVQSSPFANIGCTSEGSADGSAGLGQFCFLQADIEEDFAAEEDDSEPSIRSTELLRQVVESQEKIKALQEESSVMRGLQHRTEGRLVQAKSFHDHLLNKTAVDKDRGDARRLALEELDVSHALCYDLDNIEQKLAMLRDLYDNRDRAESMYRSGNGDCRSSVAASLSVTESQRRELQDKLLCLQRKKRQMDAVFHELCFMGESQVPDDPITSSGQDAMAIQKQPKKSMVVSREDDPSGRRDLLRDDVDPTDKIIKLDEMKSWLQTLQGMVFSHQPSQNALNAPASSNQPREISPVKGAASDQISRVPASLQLKSKRTKKPKTNNISREQSNDAVVRFSTNWIGHQQAERIGGGDDNDGDDTLDENDSEFNKKICRLHAAKDKLEKLQGFLSVAQQADQLTQQLTGDYVEDQLNALDGDLPTYNVTRGNKASPSSLSSSSRSHGKRQPEPVARSDRSRPALVPPAAASNNTPKQSANHARRLAADVSWSHPNASSSTTNARRNSNVTSHAAGGRSSRAAQTLPSNRQQQMSNHELWADMRHQMALRDELRHWEFESLMHKRAGHKNYLFNQDNRSENMSAASAKSELLMGNASTGATDGTTTATWGGSSMDNGARDTIDGNDDSQEEPNRQLNGEDCSSDEGVEVDNSVLTSTPQLDPHQSKPHNSAVNVQLDSVSAAAWRSPDETHRTPTMGPTIGDPHASHNGSANMRMSREGRHVTPDRNYLKVPTNHASGSDPAHVCENRTTTEDSYHQQQIPSASCVQTPPTWQAQAPCTTQLRHQLESVMLLCHTLLSEQHNHTCLSERLAASPSNAHSERPSPLAASNVSDRLQQPQQIGHVVVQQLLLGLSQCYHFLYLQQVEMQRIQQALQSSVTANVSCSLEGHCWHPEPRAQPSNAEVPFYSNVEMDSSRWHRDDPTSLARSSISSSSSQLPPPPPPPPPHHQHHHHHHLIEPNVFMPPESSAPPPPLPPPPPPPPPPSHPIQNIDQCHQTNTETLNNQVPPGNRANNYWDNFRSYSRQNLLSTSSSVSQPNKSNDYIDGHCMTFPRTTTSSSSAEMTAVTAAAASAARNLRIRQQSGCNDVRPTEPVASREDPPPFVGSFPTRDAVFGLPVRENNRLGLSTRRLSHDLPKDKNISGIVSHNVVKNHGNLSPNSISAPANHSSPSRNPSHAASPSKVSTKTSYMNTNSNTTTKDRVPPSDAKDSSRLHAVEDSVYAEVVSLVSRFNSEPQQLVQLLREMHKLNDGHAMRRALRALHDVSLTDTSHNDAVDTPIAPPPPPPQNQLPCNYRPGVNYLPMRSGRPFYGGSSTSSDDDEDDDEVRAHFVKAKKTSRYPPCSSRSVYELSPYSLSRFVAQQPLVQCNASTAPFGVGTGFDFSSTSHGTQHEKLVMTNDIGFDGVSKQPSHPIAGGGLPHSFSPNRALHENSTSEGGASSSTQDRESETSPDAPCSQHLNMQQLEKQMKGIMISVTSFVASFSRQVCTSKCVSSISSHIMALVLPLVQNFNQDIQSFPAGQFACILDNTLSKYVGKRFSDCEELLFSDLSDVLVNELGCFQVMLNADGNEAKKLQSCVSPKNNATAEGRRADDRRSTAQRSSPLPFQNSNAIAAQLRTDATDADLVVMARRGGDDEMIDKMHEEFSCDIPDVCVGRSSMSSSSFAAASSNSVDTSMGFSRASPSALDNLLHCDQQSNYPIPLSEFVVRAEAAAAEGHLEDHSYFDREVEIEAEEMGDTQDLAEADQSQNYTEAESVLNDVMQESGDGFHHHHHHHHLQASCWGAMDGTLANGNIDRAEDDRHNEEELGNAANATASAVQEMQGDAEVCAPELGLDEVPSKLRDPCTNSRLCSRPTVCGDQQDEHPHQQRGDTRSGKKPDHGAKS